MIDLSCECTDLPPREYQPGEVVIEEGGRSGALYFLESGTVMVKRGGVELARVDEVGTVLGEISILLNRPHIAEVSAVDTVRMYVAADAEGFLKSHPEVNLYIARSLAKKVDAMTQFETALTHEPGCAEAETALDLARGTGAKKKRNLLQSL